MQRSLTDSWTLGGVAIANRVVLAPLAGIGNWFVRLQAKRHGAGLVVSEMVSSFGLKYGDERTHREFLRIHPDEHPVSIQLFGHDPDVMREAAEIVAAKGADMIDINMGCPVRKVCKTGAGASLLEDQDKAVALARGAVEGGGGVPVTVKVRSGQRPGERTGVTLARGSLGDPWRFERLLGLRDGGPSRTEIADELRWVIDRAEEHLGVERAGRYLRKFYPWYADTMGLTKRERNPLVTAPTTAHARAFLDGLEAVPAAA